MERVDAILRHPTFTAALAARHILEDCGFTEQEIMEILTAIGGHRAPGVTAPLGRLLYRADKKSRPCYACPAVGECNWPEENKNHSLEF